MEAGRELDALIAEKPYKCRRCGNIKPKLLGGKRSCYPCHKNNGERWRKANPEKHNSSAYRSNSKESFKKWRKDWALKKRYGISLQQYNALVELQGGNCKICESNKNLRRPLVVDHCHKTGVVRGLLCDSCNIGIENFRENIQSLAAAVVYLTAPQAIGLAALKAIEHV